MTGEVQHNALRADVVVVGAGIVGLGAALAAVDRGRSVIVVERGAEISGATVRNFGHLCFTPQSGIARDYALTSREIWLRLARDAGFWIDDYGTLVVARHADELQLLRELAEQRAPRQNTDHVEVELLAAADIENLASLPAGSAVGGARLPRDLQVNPREAASAIRSYLELRGVEFRMRTSVGQIESGRVHTSRGTIDADLVVVAVNHDIDQLFPALAETHGVIRCGLDMMRVTADLKSPLGGPLLTGWSLIRYSAFTSTPASARVRARLTAERPDLAALDLNQMYTQLPDGSLIVGDSHWKGESIPPFQPEAASDAFLSEFTTLFGETPRVLERWQGVYATAPNEFLIEEVAPGVLVTVVTTGIGMTTGLGVAEHTVGGYLDARTTPTEKNSIMSNPIATTATTATSADPTATTLATPVVAIELVVLDMAGTTVVDDGIVERAFERAALRVGLDSYRPLDAALQYVRDTMGQSKIEVFRHLTDGDEAAAQTANREFENAYAELIGEVGVDAIPGAEATINSLRASGIKVALTTGFSPETRDAVLARLDWEVDAALSPADAGRGRPAPDLVLAALIATRASSVAAVAVVGDTISDVRSGRNAGAGLVIGVLTGAHTREQLEAAGADLVLESVRDLDSVPRLTGR